MITANLAEARAVNGWLRSRVEFPVRGYSVALLARSLAQRDLIHMSRTKWVTWAFALPLFLPLLIFGIPIIDASGPTDGIFKQNLFSGIAYYLALVLCPFVAGSLQRSTPEITIRRRYWPGGPQSPRAQGAAIAALVLFGAVLVGLLVWLGISMERDRLGPALINSAGVLLWVLIIMFLLASISGRRSVIRRVPQADFIRALATACLLSMHAKPAQWRDIRYRRTIAAEITLAASSLSAATVQLLRATGIGPDNAEWQTVLRAVAGLRNLAAQTVIASQEARPRLERAVAIAMQAAVAGNLARIEGGLQAGESVTSGSWLGNALTVARRLIVAFLPAALVLALIVTGDRFGWTFASDARPILIQFAILSTLVGLMSAFDPLGYQQRLGTITGAGGSLFGWGKGRG